jgi:hypothetical protein
MTGDSSETLRRAFAALAGGEHAAAEALFRAAIGEAPQEVRAYRGLGKLLVEQLRLEEAESVFESAVPLEPVPAIARYHVGLCRLLRGDYERGWAGWEQRLHVPDFKHAALKRPRWSGGKPPGRLLVISEQGYGDTIQFSRFLPQVIGQGTSLTFLCPTPLLGPYREWGKRIGAAISDRVQPGEFDAYCSIGSLTANLGIRLGDLPGPLPALEVDPEKVARYRAARPPGRCVAGVCWAGRPTHPQDRSRSMAPEHLIPLALLPGVALVGLQRPPSAPPPDGLLALDWGPEMRDFSDLAAMLMALDVVVTIDTAIAHLAGTLGRPVLLMVAHFPDWRWLLGREDSPWYPSVRVHRQRRPGEWKPVVDDVAQALRQRLDPSGMPPG